MTHSIRSRAEALGLRGLMALPTPVVRRLAGRPVVVDGQILDPEVQWMLRIRRLMREPGAEELPVEQGRRLVARQTSLTGGRQPIGTVRDLDVPGGDGPVGARLYTPRSRRGTADGTAPLVMFFHGGGFMYGDLDSHDATCRLLAERADTLVLAVDYRLSPEHRFPAAVDDCWTAYQWVVEHADRFGVDPDRLAVAGDSAGGNLAGLVALRAAGAGVPCRFQLLVYPVTNLVDDSRSRRLFGRDFYLTREFIDLAAESYVVSEADRRHPEVSLASTEKIPDELAPALVVTAGFDPLRDEGEAWARALADAGVDVQLKRYPGMIHGFFNVVGVGRNQRAAVAEIAALLKAALTVE